MRHSHTIKFSLIISIGLLFLSTFAQDPQPSKTEKDKERFDEKIDEAKSHFDEQLQAGQERFDNQINNPGQSIKKNPKKEKKQKPRKEKTEKPTADRDVVEVKCEPAQPQAKTGAFSQQNTTPDADRIVRGIRTSASVPIANITPEKARSEAIRLAKEEALRIAVGEQISASTTVIDNGTMDATVARISTIGSRGGVVGLRLTTDKAVVDANGASRYEVEIVADVKVYPEITTPLISFDVTGIKHGYSHREPLKFEITPSDSSFVYIFLFDSRGAGTQLVPSQYEPNNCLVKGYPTSFPSNRAIQYTMLLDNPISSEEINSLLVVTFRSPVSITPEVSRDIEKTLCWIYNFDPTQRSGNIEVLPIRIYNAK